MNTIKQYNPGKRWLLLFGFLILPVLTNAQQNNLADLIDRAREAGISQEQITELQNRANQRGISGDELVNILVPATALAEQNLPYELIFEKAFEGLAKGVSVQRMQPVLELLAENSEISARIVDPWVERPQVEQMIDRSDGRSNRDAFRNQMLKASSHALSQGVNENELSDFLNSLTEDDSFGQTNASGVLASINIIADLPEVDVPEQSRANIVLRALKAGFSGSDLQKLPGAMNMAQRRNQIPAAAVAKGISQQMNNGIPATQILQNLFNGNIGGGPPGNLPPGLENGRPGRGSGANNN